MNEYHIFVASDDGGQAQRSLAEWLRNDDEIRRMALVRLAHTAPGSGEMGVGLDVVQLVVDSGFQVASLALAYAAWHGSRPGQPSVTIEHGGVRVTVNGADPDAVSTIVSALSDPVQ